MAQKEQGKPFFPHGGLFSIRRDNHKLMPWRYAEKECRKRFSIHVGNVLEGSPLGYQIWTIAIYLLTMFLEEVSLMKLHHALKITQKTTWYLAHRIRMTFTPRGCARFFRHVDVDEFNSRHNMRYTDTLTQMAMLVRGLEGTRLTYDKLKEPTCRVSGARA